MLGLAYRPLTVGKRIVDARLPLRNGLEIPQLALGTYRMAPADTAAAVSAALDLDYRHLDCAPAYGNQREVGAGLRAVLERRDPKRRRVRREEVFVTSKLWPTDQHPDHVEAACRATLEQLQLDYLDLYLVHWPVCWRRRPGYSGDLTLPEDKYPTAGPDGAAAVEATVTLADTWRAMSALVDKGLVRSIGLSNCGEAELEAVIACDGCEVPVLNQIECHPLFNNAHVQSVNGKHQALTGSYCPLCVPSRFSPPDFVGLCDREDIRRLAEHCGMSPQRLLLCWNADMNNVIAVKSTNVEHLKSNAKAGRQCLDASARLVLDNYEEIVGAVRLMNPIGYRKPGEPFFP